jgi:hypothetical protein
MTRIILGVIWTLALCTCASMAQADFFTGNDLKARLVAWEDKSNNDSVSSSIGAGYVIGVADAFNGIYICLPASVTLGQVSAIVLKYLNQHPEDLHKWASVLSYNALIASFPCKKKNDAANESTSAPPASPPRAPRSKKPMPQEKPESPFE